MANPLEDMDRLLAPGLEVTPADGSDFNATVVEVDRDNDLVAYRCAKTGAIYTCPTFRFCVRYIPADARHMPLENALTVLGVAANVLRAELEMEGLASVCEDAISSIRLRFTQREGGA